MVKRKVVSFWAKKPAQKNICFKNKDGRKVCFNAKVSQKTKVRFLARK